MTAVVKAPKEGLFDKLGKITNAGHRFLVQGIEAAAQTATATAASLATLQTQIDGIGGIPAPATQAEQEAGAAGTAYVAPATQHNHQSAAKCWGYITVTAGAPTLQGGYNIDSIADTATAKVTVTLTVPFSTVNWACVGSVGYSAEGLSLDPLSQAAGSVILYAKTQGLADTDPDNYSFAGFGDQ